MAKLWTREQREEKKVEYKEQADWAKLPDMNEVWECPSCDIVISKDTKEGDECICGHVFYISD